MTATTQRLTINQTWQQVATGNVTLIGCNTAANYHINIGADKPTDKSAFVTDKLGEPTAYNYGVPVWVKLDVNNQIDEADLIVLGEAVVPAPDVPVTPPSNTLVFSELQNCTYANDTLAYTDGFIPIFNGTAYQAFSSTPVGISIVVNNSDYINVFFGENTDLLSYQDGVANGSCWTRYSDAVFSTVNESLSTNDVAEVKDFSRVGDVINFVVVNAQLTITNVTQNKSWTSPQSDYLATPKYLGVGVRGTDPLTIKAI